MSKKNFDTSKAVEPTGVIVDVLKRDAKKIGIDDLDQMSIYSLGRFCDQAARNNPNKFPNRDDFKTYYIYSRGIVIASDVGQADKDRLMKEFPEAIFEQEFDQIGYEAALSEYSYYESVVRQVFVWGLYYLKDVMDNPKATKCLLMAWDRSHYSGYADVANEFSELVKLIK